jgi:hypothetical protein
MSLRRAARDGSLIFCGAVGAYLVSAVLAARLALGLSAVLEASPSVVLRVAVGAVTLDLSKALGLLAAAWFLGPRVGLPPLAGALGLVALTYAVEAGITTLLQQASWLLFEPWIVLCRVALAGLLVMGARWILRRRREG